MLSCLLGNEQNLNDPNKSVRMVLKDGHDWEDLLPLAETLGPPFNIKGLLYSDLK